MSVASWRRNNAPTEVDGSPGLDSLLEALQAIASERLLPNLLLTIMEQTLSLSGARRGSIVLNHRGGWVVAAQGRANRVPVCELRNISLQDDEDIPQTVLDHVGRTGKAVRLDKTHHYGAFTSDPYLKRARPRSIQCLPLLNAGRLTGILYTEYCHVEASAFEHADSLSLLAPLFALAIDNARKTPLYRENESGKAITDDHTDMAWLSGGLAPGARRSGGRQARDPSDVDPLPDSPLTLARQALAKCVAERDTLQARLQEVESAETYFQGLLEAVPDATVITTRDGRIALVNRQTESLFGYRRDELVGQSIENLIPERFHGAHVKHRSRFARSPEVRPMGQGLQLLGRHHDGSEFPIDVSLSFFETPDGLHILSSIRDVSGLRATERALRNSERFSRATFDALTEHICVLDERGTVADTNTAWKTFAAANDTRPERVQVGTNYLEVCGAMTGPEAPALHAFADGIRAMIRGEQDYCAAEYSCQTPHGQRWFIARATRFSGDGPARIVVAHENITELKLAVQALRTAKEAESAARRQAETAERQIEERRQQTERRQQAAETLREVLATLNSSRPLDDVLHFIVSQSRRLLGGQAAALFRRETDGGGLEIQVGDGLALDPVNDQQSNQAESKSSPITAEASAESNVLAPLVETIAETATDVREMSPDATAIPVPKPFQSVLAIPVGGAEQDYGSLAIYRQDWRRFTPEEASLAALFGDQAALAVENARLRDKAKEAAVLAERDRIARDLHDAVTQSIFSASLIADSLPRIWELSPEEGRRGLDELRQLTHGALVEMRTLLFELRPAALLEKKLGDLVTQLGAALSSRTRVSVDVAVNEEGSLPPDVHVALFRIVQEALNNVAKHAGARHVMAHVRSRPDRALLRVLDDGRGFDTAELPGGQLGFGIMRERAGSIGARLRVHSRPGRGTIVVVTWDDSGRRPSDG